MAVTSDTPRAPGEAQPPLTAGIEQHFLAGGEAREDQVKAIARLLCKQAGHDPDGAARSGYGWRNYEKDAREVIDFLRPSARDGECEREAFVRHVAAAIYADVCNEPLGDLWDRPPSIQNRWLDATRAALSADRSDPAGERQYDGPLDDVAGRLA